MSEIVSFRDLDVWNVGMDLVVTVYDVASRLPQTERYELSAQIRRAVVSIPSNVAEGYAYRGRRYLHHVRIALGSLAELDTQLEAAVRLGLLGPDVVAGVGGQLDRTGQLLHGLLRSLLLGLLKQAATGAAVLALGLCLLYG
jgi:four helix bundle protein